MDYNTNSNSSSPTPVLWHILIHYDLDRFRSWLDALNARRLDAGLYLFEPFFPFDFLSRRVAETSFSALPDDFRNLVFLRGRDDDISELILSWNRTYVYRLHCYRDADGKPATVPEREMREFFDNCTRYRGFFEVRPSVREIVSLDRVEILSGPFAGHEADVVRASHSKGKVNLELSLTLASGVLSVSMKHVRSNQVVRLNSDFSGLIHDDFIERAQNRILTVYAHRVGRKNDKLTREADVRKLNEAYHYNGYEVENKSAHAHFRALMLICAHLRHDKDAVERLKEEVLQLLNDINRNSPSKAATDTRAYLWIALYITTNDPAYREAAKDYVRSHNPKSRKLRRFISLMRKGKKV